MPIAVTDPNWLRSAQGEVWEYASGDLESLFRSLDLGNPKRSRDVLLREVPQLTSFYGEQVALDAVDWYDELRYLEGVPGRYRAKMAPTFPERFVQKRIRYGAGHLFTDRPNLMLPFLLDSAQKYVLQPGRDTIQLSAANDPNASGWMRVTSSNACDFCVMLAGRGDVYKRRTAMFASHGNCNCSAAPSWDPNASEVPVSAYEASERMQKVRNRAADGDEDAHESLRWHRGRARSFLEDEQEYLEYLRSHSRR